MYATDFSYLNSPQTSGKILCTRQILSTCNLQNPLGKSLFATCIPPEWNAGVDGEGEHPVPVLPGRLHVVLDQLAFLTMPEAQENLKKGVQQSNASV